MNYVEAMELVHGTDGSMHVRRRAWRSPKAFVRHFDRYTRYTGFRGGYSCCGWYPCKQEDVDSLDWYVSWSVNELQELQSSGSS